MISWSVQMQYVLSCLNLSLFPFYLHSLLSLYLLFIMIANASARLASPCVLPYDKQSTLNDIDKSIIQYLSLLLDTSADNTLVPAQRPVTKRGPYWRNHKNPFRTQKGWLGNDMECISQESTLLHDNTLRNSKTPVIEQTEVTKIRYKTVSFDETVIIISEDTQSQSKLKQGNHSLIEDMDDTEDSFMDAVDTFDIDIII
ncbi:hypothetical protein BDB01DRAFT_458319 [Pilobolus umbonatus]|nr:hypothetical protein BDB01DRAFT_458319 [Pilobolus umbonatus]